MPFSFSSLSHPHPRPAALPQRLSRTTPLLFLFLLIRHTAAQYHHPHRNVHGDGEGDTPRSVYLISHTDFCLFGPPSPLPSNTSSISQINKDVVSWCTDRRHGNRVVPEGTLNGVTYVKTNSWVQVSGTGDFTKINIPAGDQGAQFDSVENTPDGAVLYTTDGDQAASWVTMISSTIYCVRACSDAQYCPTVYDEMGCYFFTSNGIGWDGVYQDCVGDEGDPPGVYVDEGGQTVTYTQGGGWPTFSIPARRGPGQLFRQALLARQQGARNRWASRGWAGGRRGEQ
ncbi:hypothetical protein C365_04630 [Cryptococcus neoformans Bt85]|nr:hypothetical protein C365_04630 [Cryptococcus neoformans var. grubii Bt85]